MKFSFPVFTKTKSSINNQMNSISCAQPPSNLDLISPKFKGKVVFSTFIFIFYFYYHSMPGLI